MFSKRRKSPAPEMPLTPEACVAAAVEVPEAQRSAPAVEPTPPRCANVIASDALIKGSITAAQDLEIAGIVRGDIECRARLVIAAGGKVHGRVRARELVIDGIIEGDVEVAERLSIGCTGQLIGDAIARTVAIAEGAVVSGSCSMGRRSAPASALPETIFLSHIMEDDEETMPIGRTALGPVALLGRHARESVVLARAEGA